MTEKDFIELTDNQKQKAYNIFLKTGNYDTFEGFCKMMNNSIFNNRTLKPIEVN